MVTFQFHGGNPLSRGGGLLKLSDKIFSGVFFVFKIRMQMEVEGFSEATASISILNIPLIPWEIFKHFATEISVHHFQILNDFKMHEGKHSQLLNLRKN